MVATQFIMVDISRARQITGWMSKQELLWLAETAERYDTALEIGSYYGRSARAIGEHIRQRLHCVDPWEGQYLTKDNKVLFTFRGHEVYDKFLENNLDLINTYKIFPVKKRFQEIAFTEQFDFIFIDGDHRYEVVKGDIDKALGLVKEGGILAGHDYGRPDWPGVEQAVTEIFPQQVQVVDTIWWVQR